MEMREQIERVESDRQSRNHVCFDPHPYGAARTEKTSPQHTVPIRMTDLSTPASAHKTSKNQGIDPMATLNHDP
jgi:hypothetical protein